MIRHLWSAVQQSPDVIESITGRNPRGIPREAPFEAEMDEMWGRLWSGLRGPSANSRWKILDSGDVVTAKRGARIWRSPRVGSLSLSRANRVLAVGDVLTVKGSDPWSVILLPVWKEVPLRSDPNIAVLLSEFHETNPGEFLFVGMGLAGNVTLRCYARVRV